MCDTRQHDGSIKGEQEDALTQASLPRTTQEHSERGEENWRRLAKLAEAETDPNKLMDLAQQLMNELDREAATKSMLALTPLTGGGGIQGEGQ